MDCVDIFSVHLPDPFERQELAGLGHKDAAGLAQVQEGEAAVTIAREEASNHRHFTKV